jgi:hypothetical protein
VIIVYTAIFGGSDSLKKAPPADRCVLITDDQSIDVRGCRWEIVRSPQKEPRPRRAARSWKMGPHELFPEAEAWIWVDGSIEIRDWQRLMTDIGDADMACLAHPDRSTCYAEGETVIRLKIAHDLGRSQINAALAKYRAEGFAPTSLSTTGLLYRRNTPEVVAFNRLWRAELDQYGTNDQVHVDYCAWKAGVSIKYLEGHYRANPYAVYDKADHHKRRKPQFLPESECQHYLAEAP